MCTFAVLDPEFRSSLKQELDDIEATRLNGSHERGRSVECLRFEVGSEVKQVLDHVLQSAVTREVQRRPAEVVLRRHVCPETIAIAFIYLFLFILAISIAPLQVHFYSEVLPTQHGYCVGVSHRSATGNCE